MNNTYSNIIMNTHICYSITHKLVPIKQKQSLLAIGEQNKIIIILLEKHRQLTKHPYQIGDKQIEKLKITCLKFSSEQELTLYFGTDVGKIGFLKLTNDFTLEGLQLFDLFQNKITQIKTYNYFEKEYIMISSYDTTIQSYKLQETKVENITEKEKWEFQKMCELQGHKNAVLWIDIFEQKKEQKVLMISSETGPFIFLWQLYKQEWKIQFKFWKKQFGNRISFFDDGSIIWQLFKIPEFKILNYDGKNITEQQHIKIPYFKNNDDIQETETDSFPMIYNRQKNIIVSKYCDKIYIIYRNLNYQGLIKVSETLIECNSKISIYTISENGKHLYLFDNQKKEIKCFKIHYE